MATRLTEIEGIGVVHCEKLMSVGIRSVEQLLGYCGKRNAREALAGHTGISEQLVLKWVNKADLSRISGITAFYAEVLEHVGVCSVADLAQRDAMRLHAALCACHDQELMPSLLQLAEWIEQAKQLPVRVYH